MSMQLTKTTDDDGLILRFLSAAEARIKGDPGRVPINSTEAKLAITWLRGLVGCINEDGSLHRPDFSAARSSEVL